MNGGSAPGCLLRACITPEFSGDAPGKTCKGERQEVGSRKSEFRTAECRTSTRSNDWFTSKFYILHSTFVSPDRCSPLLFHKIKAEKANKINLLGDREAKFPCINNEYSVVAARRIGEPVNGRYGNKPEFLTFFDSLAGPLTCSSPLVTAHRSLFRAF